MTAPDVNGVCALLADYFDGLYHGDTARLQRVFHPLAHYQCIDGGALLRLDMPAYLDRVAKRPSPVAAAHPRTDRLCRLSFAGPDTALAEVECSIPGRSFRDFLSLLRLDGRWQIVAKVFHGEGEAV